MTDQVPVWMARAFSPARLGPYLRATGGEAAAAVRLYWWNVEASAALYGPLHCMEIALRNALHRELTAFFGRPDWWTVAPLNESSMRQVAASRAKCRGEPGGRRGPIPHDSVVAGLNLGFWVALLSKGGRGGAYDRRLWVPTLHKAFPYYSGRRDELHGVLDSLRKLRNRIMHHDSIYRRDLVGDHNAIYRVLGHIDPVAAKEVLVLDRFPAVLGHRRAAHEGGRSPSF
ncbi:hypothetical protein [Streptomyces marincola]|uniref:Abi-like protein n=1 Tax=Streptomyces marincola TaxID=2878388 RepID=A0A1W7CWX4_9ACTN|nr:hypothetical protein [Streptomyces marincola]ARQ69314.1 hypothetical protein CAG99_10920 [Streptomyces marincola]UCM89616.1 hypothetical protein LC193_17605 [Streptomyces marincola]